MKSADNEIIQLLNRIYDAQAGGGGGAPAFAEITGDPADNTALDAALDLKAPLASPTFTGTVVIPTPFTLGGVSVLPTGTELNFVDGVTSAIQTQLNAKGPAPSDTAYDEATWDGVTTIAPSKNAVRDKIEAVVASIPGQADIASGTYTPIVQAGAVNLDADPTTTVARYMRVGTVVTVSGGFSANPTISATDTLFEIDLPVATTGQAISGVAASAGVASLSAKAYGANINAAAIRWISVDSASQDWSYTFTYLIEQ